MALESAQKWIKHIHNDNELGRKLLAIPQGEWNTYESIAKEHGFEFSENELNEAWDLEFGKEELNEAELDQIVGGVAGGPRGRSAAMGVRG